MKTVINVKTNPEVKRNARRIANDLGLSLSAVVNAYLKQFVRTREVHISAAPRMTAALEHLLGPIEADIRRGRNLSRPITSPEELDEYLAAP